MVRQGSQAETTELARVLCLAMVEPSFGQALLDNPVRAVRSCAQHDFRLTEEEQHLLLQYSLCSSIEELAARIERQRDAATRLGRATAEHEPLL